MSNPIRIVPMGDDAYAITGLAQCDVQVHVAYRVPTDATETHNYHANIDGLPNYVARGASELGAAEAVCARFIADLTKPPTAQPGEPSGPEALLVYLADNERVRRDEAGARYGTRPSIASIAREEAYRAAAQIVHAAKVLAEPTEAQKRLWAGMARACAEYDGTGRDAPTYALGLTEAIKIGGAVIDRIVNESAEAVGWKPLPCAASGGDEACDDKPSLSEVG